MGGTGGLAPNRRKRSRASKRPPSRKPKPSPSHLLKEHNRFAKPLREGIKFFGEAEVANRLGLKPSSVRALAAPKPTPKSKRILKALTPGKRQRIVKLPQTIKTQKKRISALKKADFIRSMIRWGVRERGRRTPSSTNGLLLTVAQGRATPRETLVRLMLQAVRGAAATGFQFTFPKRTGIEGAAYVFGELPVAAFNASVHKSRWGTVRDDPIFRGAFTFSIARETLSSKGERGKRKDGKTPLYWRTTSKSSIVWSD